MTKLGPGLETAFKQTVSNEILEKTAKERGGKILDEEGKKNGAQKLFEKLPGIKQFKDWRNQQEIKQDLEAIAGAQERVESPDTQGKNE